MLSCAAGVGRRLPKCEAADAEEKDIAVRKRWMRLLGLMQLVSDAKDREDICDWCAVEGKVDYAALYETLSHVLAEDRRLRKGPGRACQIFY